VKNDSEKLYNQTTPCWKSLRWSYLCYIFANPFLIGMLVKAIVYRSQLNKVATEQTLIKILDEVLIKIAANPLQKLTKKLMFFSLL